MFFLGYDSEDDEDDSGSIVGSDTEQEYCVSGVDYDILHEETIDAQANIAFAIQEEEEPQSSPEVIQLDEKADVAELVTEEKVPDEDLESAEENVKEINTNDLKDLSANENAKEPEIKEVPDELSELLDTKLDEVKSDEVIDVVQASDSETIDDTEIVVGSVSEVKDEATLLEVDSVDASSVAFVRSEPEEIVIASVSEVEQQENDTTQEDLRVELDEETKDETVVLDANVTMQLDETNNETTVVEIEEGSVDVNEVQQEIAVSLETLGDETYDVSVMETSQLEETDAKVETTEVSVEEMTSEEISPVFDVDVKVDLESQDVSNEFAKPAVAEVVSAVEDATSVEISEATESILTEELEYVAVAVEESENSDAPESSFVQIKVHSEESLKVEESVSEIDVESPVLPIDVTSDETLEEPTVLFGEETDVQEKPATDHEINFEEVSESENVEINVTTDEEEKVPEETQEIEVSSIDSTESKAVVDDNGHVAADIILASVSEESEEIVSDTIVSVEDESVQEKTIDIETQEESFEELTDIQIDEVPIEEAIAEHEDENNEDEVYDETERSEVKDTQKERKDVEALVEKDEITISQDCTTEEGRLCTLNENTPCTRSAQKPLKIEYRN